MPLKDFLNPPGLRRLIEISSASSEDSFHFRQKPLPCVSLLTSPCTTARYFVSVGCTAFAVCWYIIRPSRFEKASLFLSVWLSPNCPLVKKRLIQVNLYRLFLLLSSLDSMLQHIFNKNLNVSSKGQNRFRSLVTISVILHENNTHMCTVCAACFCNFHFFHILLLKYKTPPCI